MGRAISTSRFQSKPHSVQEFLVSIMWSKCKLCLTFGFCCDVCAKRQGWEGCGFNESSVCGAHAPFPHVSKASHIYVAIKVFLGALVLG